MNASNPSKEDVRAWLKHEVEQHRPPPALTEIRRKLGWHIVKTDRNSQGS